MTTRNFIPKMVRNNKGGKHGKKMARKHVNAEQPEGPRKARIPVEEGEMFACCTKLFGNGMVLVVDFSGTERICIIRKKFKGRGKRKNTVQRGTVLLVGDRCFEAEASGKRPKCDLLEVYDDKEKQLLRKQCPNNNWSFFDGYADAVNDVEDDDVVEFVNEQADYRSLMNDLGAGASEASSGGDDDDESRDSGEESEEDEQ